MEDVYIFDTTLQEIVDWFLAQPVFGQFLIILGAITLLVFAVIVVYYVLKGVGYLIYYVLKGVYYLLKGIGLLFYKACEGLYYLISGKPRPKSEDSQEQQEQPQVSEPIQQQVPVQKTFQAVHPEIAYCTECGNRFTNSMIHTLSDKGFVYCVHCGKGFSNSLMVIQIQ